MKPIKDILGDTKPKNIAKIEKAFVQGNCRQFMEVFMEEALKPTAMDFPKVKCLVTEHYFCCYSSFGGGLTNMMTVVPLDQIVNLYRSNIGNNGEYDYDNFHITIELRNGNRRHVASVPRNAKTFMTIFEEVLAYTRSRITVMEGL